MDQAEYDKQFKSKTPLVSEELAGSFQEDGPDSPWRPKITVINDGPQDQYDAEMRFLTEAGADYAGKESEVAAMRRASGVY